MKFVVLLMVAMALFASMVAAGKKQLDMKELRQRKGFRTTCFKGRKKNGKCVTGKLRVRSADSDEYFEVPHVVDAHWGEVDAE